MKQLNHTIVGNPKAEIRNPKEARNPKSEIRRERRTQFWISTFGIRVYLLGLMLYLGAAAGFAAPGALIEWTFNRPGDFQGWQPNGHLADVVITNGALSCRAVGTDPILELRASLDVKTSPRQVVEIRLKADRDGVAELFWSNTSEGRYGGFAQEKTTRFNVRGDNAWHTYRLMPFWHREGRIVRLRFDLFDGARFDLASLRLIELDTPQTAGKLEFDFNQHPEAWQWIEPSDEGAMAAAWARGRVTRCGAGLLLGPPVKFNAATNSYISIRMSVDRGQHGTLFFASDNRSGLHSQTFRLQADGREHTYNLDMLPAREWRGAVVALGLQPSNDTNAVATLRRIRVGDEPEGAPQLRVVSFTLEEPLARAGLPATLTATVSNSGGEPATNLHAIIELPAGVSLDTSVTVEQALARLEFDQERTLSWKVRSREPLAGQARLKLTAANSEPVAAAAAVRFTPRLSVPPGGYVPEPKPVRGPFEVGAYYFPGWKTASQWQPLQRFPERKPVLGWYREGDPEVADWHIKWAVEHGITFFAYDWYWSQGARQLEHALHQGYFQARYRHLLKFCLLWANHNAPGSSSHEDCLAVTRFWIDNYFKRPEHLRFEGKPVMIIFAPDRLTQDLGSEGVKRAFAAMREECRRAGLPGLYLIACVGEVAGARRAAEETYDSVSAYNWPSLGMTGEGLYASFETLPEGYRRHWDHFLAEQRLPLCPLPVCGGWDSRPWHGDNDLVRFGRTPALFKRHLRDARNLLESGRYQPAPAKAILVEAWNEWGEGSYIEPHSEFGFGYLDAVREVFTDAPTLHDDATPADAGMGPYDVPAPETTRTAWEFERDEEAWINVMQFADLKIAGGVLSARTTGTDPAFFSTAIHARASDFNAIVVRMRLSGTNSAALTESAQVFWRTTRLAESESTSAHFEVRIDGQWHDYRIPVAQNARWRGTITALRLDPVSRPGINVELDRVGLSP